MVKTHQDVNPGSFAITPLFGTHVRWNKEDTLDGFLGTYLKKYKPLEGLSISENGLSTWLLNQK